MNAQNEAVMLRGGWKPEEDSLLFELVNEAHEQGKPLKTVFEQVASKTGRRPNSIRNYYYARIKEGDGRELGLGQSAAFIPFTDEEIESLLRTVLSEQAKGVSVRACTLAMGCGDNKLMLRYQNKYRSLIKSNPKLVKRIIEEMKSEGADVFDPYEIQKGPRRAGRPRKNTEGLVDAISGVVNDLNRVDGLDVTSFFESIGALAVGAAKGAEAVSRLQELESGEVSATDIIRLKEQNGELREQVHAQAMELEAQKERFTSLLRLFRQLMSVNREFLCMTSVVKMSYLSSYIRELTRNVEDCEKLIIEYAN